MGTGDRSEKIRTYNVLQDRITDHRIKRTWHNIEKILAGELDPIIDAIQDYNTFIQQFPNSIWAGMAGFAVNNDYFKVSPGAQNVPKVSF